MYTTAVFEIAMKICGYYLSRIHKGDSPYVREVEGAIPIVKRIIVDGNRQTRIHNKAVRWNDVGRCYSKWSNKRYRQYDLPLQTVYEDQQRKEVGNVCR